MNADELRSMVEVRAQISRAYADSRFREPNRWGHDVRMFVITALWLINIEKVPRGQRFNAIAQKMRMKSAFEFWELIRHDLPRYEPDSLRGPAKGCVEMLPRAKRPCGRSMDQGFNVTNPVDGTWELVAYCGRHRAEGRAAWEAEKRRQAAGGIPEPVPNRGGLLPSYLPQFRWEKNYATAGGTGWEPPVLGMCADDWPILAKVEMARPTPPRLKVLFGGSEIPALDMEDADEYEPPHLSLISREED